MTERQYATAGGKRYPLKTDQERASPAAPQSPQPNPQRAESSSQPSEGYANVNVPHGNRTVLLAMLVSFGTFALAGPSGLAKLTRLQGVIGAQGAKSATGASNTLSSVQRSGGDIGDAAPSVFTPRVIFGWLFLFLILTIMADFDATSNLAGAFAMLIMLSTLLTLGPDALANVTKLTKVGS